MSNARAVATGFSARPLADTVTDTLAWLSSAADSAPGGAMSRAREAQLLADYGKRR